MNLIAYWGKEYFRVSPKMIFTFNNFQRSSAGRYNTFERIGQKPLTEYTGPGLDQVTYTAILNRTFHVIPRDVLDYWNRLCNSGKADVLVVGNKLVGKNLWTLKSVQENWTRIDGQGNVLSASMDLTFEEYVDK